MGALLIVRCDRRDRQLRQDRTFIEADVNEWLWVGSCPFAVTEVMAGKSHFSPAAVVF